MINEFTSLWINDAILTWQKEGVKLLPGVYRNAIDCEKVADSFKEFVELLNADSELLYC